MAGRFLSLFKVFRGRKMKDLGAAPAQQPEDPEQIQALQDDAAQDKTRQREPGRGRLHKTLKRFRKFLSIRRSRKVGPAPAEGTAQPDSGLTELQAEPDVSPDSVECSQDSGAAVNEDRAKADKAVTEDVVVTNTKTTETEDISNTGTMTSTIVIHAPTKDIFKESAAPSQQQVPEMVRSIHQSLLCHVTVEARLQLDIVRLAEQHPADVVLTLLRCAPTCDRAAAVIWRTIGSSRVTMEKVLPTLVRVMEDWPLHRARTSDGDDGEVFALAATLVIWVIVHTPQYHEATIHSFYPLFTALLCQVAITTQQMPPEEVDNFWRACQEQHRLPSKLNRFAVQAMKALLYLLQCDNEVMAMERKCGWDTLLCAHTQHYAMGLLAREMRCVLTPLCSHVAYHLLLLLSSEKPRWDLPLLAFLVEVLQCLDLRKCAFTVVKIMSSCLQSKCRERRRLALRGLVVVSKDPSVAKPLRSVSRSLLKLLGDADGEVVSMSLSLFKKMLQNNHLVISSTSAPKLAGALLPLFDNDNSQVQLLSIYLFRKVMEMVVDEGKKHLKAFVNQSLLPLFLHCHEENQCVAEASRETLHCAAGFLEKTDLQRTLKTEQPLKIDECLLAEDGSQAAQQMQWALRFLESPQEPLREAAVRIIGSAGRCLRAKREELRAHSQAI